MRIVELHFPDGHDYQGLKKIEMDRLGPVVVLAGANGAGKTRLLNLVRQTAKEYEPVAWVDAKANELRSTQARLATVQSQIRSADDGTPTAIKRMDSRPTEGQIPLLQSEEERLTKEADRLEGELKQRRVWRNRIVVSPQQEQGSFAVHQVQLTSDDPSDPDTYASEAIRARAAAVGRLQEFEPRDVLFYIRHLQQRNWDATHPDTRMAPPECEAIRESYRSLQDAIRQALQTELRRDNEGRPTLFGLPVASARLSEGQKVLLQLTVRLHAQGASLGGAILILDVPETHLHPKALLEVYSRLRAAVSDGQLWIATHSVHLLAEVAPHAIWYMEKGAVRFAGSGPERVLGGLMGGDEGIGKLGDFVRMPALHASARFAAQCLVPPTVAEHRSADKQMMQVMGMLQSLREEGSPHPLKVLDIGAGKGRLLDAAIETCGSQDKVSELLDYRAFERDPELHELLKERIGRVYGPETVPLRLFGSDLELGNLDDHSVDVAVCCNVLHEIVPGSWGAFLGPESRLAENV